MRTRQLRLDTPDQIRTRLKEFSGNHINIVLHNGTVLFGILDSVDGSQLKMTNMRQHSVTLPLPNILEVYLDIKEPAC